MPVAFNVTASSKPPSKPRSKPSNRASFTLPSLPSLRSALRSPKTSAQSHNKPQSVSRRKNLTKPSISVLEQSLLPTNDWRTRNHRICVFLSTDLYIGITSTVLICYCVFSLLVYYSSPTFLPTLSTIFYSQIVAIASWSLVTLSILDALSVSIDEGFGHRVTNAGDLYIVALLPWIMFFEHRANDIHYPYVALRIFSLLPRSQAIRNAILRARRHPDLPFCFTCLTPKHHNTGSAPSDIPVLRLVQLMRRTITGTASIYTHAEIVELKYLLLQLCQQRLYSSTGGGRGGDKETVEEKEYDEMRKVWTGHVGFTLTSDTVMPRRSTFNSSELRARGISCPDRVVVGGQLPTLGARMAAGKVSIQASVDAYLEVILDEWDFSVVQLGRISKNRPLTGLALHIFSDTRYMWARLCRTNEFHFEKYVSEVEKTYGDNVYHNKSHAADVTQSVHYMLSQNNFGAKIPALSKFSMLFSAMIHDYGHVGVSNAFLIKTGDAIAITYNDQSVLENYHVSKAFMVLQQDDKNFMAKMTASDKLKVRELVIQLVLATDLKSHFDLVADFKSLTAVASEATKMDPDGEHTGKITAKCVLSAMKICMKCADIGHPTKSRAIHLKWSRLIMMEFFAQGAREKEMGMDISSLCDGDDIASIPSSQKGFINFLVRPLFTAWVDYLESDEDINERPGLVKESTDVFFSNMKKNIAMWGAWGNGTAVSDVGLSTPVQEGDHKKSRFGETFHPDHITLLEKEYERALVEEYQGNQDINNPLHSKDAHHFENRYPPEGFRHTTGAMYSERKSDMSGSPTVVSKTATVSANGEGANGGELSLSAAAAAEDSAEIDGVEIKRAKQNRRSLPTTVLGSFQRTMEAMGGGKGGAGKAARRQTKAGTSPPKETSEYGRPKARSRSGNETNLVVGANGVKAKRTSSRSKTLSFANAESRSSMEGDFEFDVEEEQDFEYRKKKVEIEGLRSSRASSPRRFITSGAEFDEGEEESADNKV